MEYYNLKFKFAGKERKIDNIRYIGLARDYPQDGLGERHVFSYLPGVYDTLGPPPDLAVLVLAMLGAAANPRVVGTELVRVPVLDHPLGETD
jgi:hypothetical protein